MGAVYLVFAWVFQISTADPADVTRRTHQVNLQQSCALEHPGDKTPFDECKKKGDEVIASLLGATAVLILGPGEAKGEFAKHIKSKKLGGVTIELETVDKMTDRQVAAKVSEHFTPAPASKSAAPKKAAHQSVSAKRPTKAGK